MRERAVRERAERERAEPPPGAAGAPGWAAAVFDREGVQERWLHGPADTRTGAPVRAHTPMRWFSITKLVTATAVLALVERERLGLDDEARARCPWMAPLGGATVRQLLAHASGLPDPAPHRWVHPPGAARRTPEQLTRDELRAPTGPVGRARYTNLGYLVLGELVAAASGEPFARALADTVLGPAGIDASFSPTPAAVGHEALSLRAAVMGLMFATRTPGLVSHRRGRWIGLRPFELEGQAYGGLLGSIDALTRLGRLHLNDGTLDGVRVISAEHARQMRSRQSEGREGGFGFGWWQLGGGWVGHGGQAGGFRSALRIHPGRGLGVAVLANGGAASTERVADRLADRAG